MMNPPWKKMNHPFLSILSITKAHARGPPLQATVALLFGTTMHALAGHSDDGYKGFTLWVNISLLFLIDSNIGSMMRKSYLRILGTVLGGALVVPMIVSVHEIRKKDTNLCEVASGAILASSVALVSLVCRCYKKKFGAKYEYMFVVCELTFVVCGVGGFYKEEPVINALERVLSVVMAVVIALAVARTVTPIYAADAARMDAAEAAKEIRDVLGIIVDVYLNFSFEGSMHTDDDGDGIDDALFERLEKDSLSQKQQSAMSRLSRVGGLISAAEVEIGKTFNGQEYRVLAQGLSRLYNAMIAMLFPLESGSAATELVRKYRHLIDDVQKQLNVALTSMSETALIENHNSEECVVLFNAMTDGAVRAKLCSDVLERALDEEEAKSGRQSLTSPSLYTFTQFVKTYAHVTTYVLVCVSKYKPSEYDKIANALDKSEREEEEQRKNEEEEADDGGSDTNSHSSTRKYKYAERRSSMKYFTKTRMGGGKSNDSNV